MTVRGRYTGPIRKIDPLDYIQWDLTPSLPETAPAEGLTYWNEDDGTLNIGMPGGEVNLQVGQEMIKPVANVTGSTILNGTPVYISGVSGNRLTVAPADAEFGVGVAFRTYAVATEDIAHNDTGYVTKLGVVRGIDLSSFSGGDALYLAVGGSGVIENYYTATPPTAPDVTVLVGIVEKATASGELEVRITTIPNLNSLSDVNDSGQASEDMLIWDAPNNVWKSSTVQTVQLEPTGFPNRTDTTISFNVSSPDRTFTIAPTGSTFDYWREAKQVTKTGSQTVQISDTTGLHYIYFDSSDDLVSSTTPWTFDGGNVFVATIYWREAGSDYLLQEERHGLAMDWASHQYLHDTVGVAYESGLTMTPDDPNPNTFVITAGEIHDEDLEIDISEQTTSRILYRDGVTGTWIFDTAASTYFKETANIIQYDNNGTLADVTSGSFVSYYAFATNDTTNPIYMIMGQRTDTNIANALNNQGLGSLSLANLPSAEMKPIWQVILKRTGTSESVERTIDLRVISTLSTGNFTAQDHGALGGLSDDDHSQYALLAGRSGGQTLQGGTASGDDLTLESTSNATKGTIIILNDDLELKSSSSQTYNTGRRSDLLTLQGQTASTKAGIEIYAKDGGSAEENDVRVSIFGIGIPSDLVPYSECQWIYVPADDCYYLRTRWGDDSPPGTTYERALCLETEDSSGSLNTGQLKLLADGNITSSGNFTAASGTISSSTIIAGGGALRTVNPSSSAGTNCVLNNVVGSVWEVRLDSSSERFKENFRPISVDTSKIYDLIPQEFQEKASLQDEREQKAIDRGDAKPGEYRKDRSFHTGLRAEQVREIFPNITHAHIDNDGNIDNTKVDGLDYRAITMYMLEEMKKMRQEVDRLNQRVTELERI
jgi:hypothetical protein